jgi:hypothetical protein
VPRLEQAADMRLDARQLGYIVDCLVDGGYATDYFLDNDRIVLVIKGDDRFVQRTQDIRSLPRALVNLPLVKKSMPKSLKNKEKEKHRVLALVKTSLCNQLLSSHSTGWMRIVLLVAALVLKKVDRTTHWLISSMKKTPWLISSNQIKVQRYLPVLLTTTSALIRKNLLSKNSTQAPTWL